MVVTGLSKLRRFIIWVLVLLLVINIARAERSKPLFTASPLLVLQLILLVAALAIGMYRPVIWQRLRQFVRRGQKP
jgi:hypothetical protein